MRSSEPEKYIDKTKSKAAAEFHRKIRPKKDRQLPALMTSLLGSLPRPVSIVALFKDYGDIYQKQGSLGALETYVRKVVTSQDHIGLDIVNDGEVQRSGFFTVFYDSFEGFLHTSLPTSYRLWKRVPLPPHYRNVRLNSRKNLFDVRRQPASKN